METTPPRWLTRAEVARRLGMSLENVRRLTRDGVLRAVPAGRRAIRYRERDVRRLIEHGFRHSPRR